MFGKASLVSRLPDPGRSYADEQERTEGTEASRSKALFWRFRGTPNESVVTVANRSGTPDSASLSLFAPGSLLNRFGLILIVISGKHSILVAMTARG